MKPPRILVNTLFTLFKRHSHPVHILLTKRTYLYINQWIRRREGMKEKIALPDVFPLQQDVSAPHFLSSTDCFPSPCGQSALQCRRRNTLACEENRSTVLQTPSIGIADKVKADLHEIPNFHFTLTSPDFTLSSINILLSTRVRDNILKSKEQKNIQPTKGGHKMVTCQNYVSLFYCQITSCPSDGGIS